MNPRQDPAILAADALNRAGTDYDSACESRDDGRIIAASLHVDILDRAFTTAIPTTLIGVRRKADDMFKILRPCEDPEGNTLTTKGASYLCLHLESIIAGLAQPRLTAL